MQCTHITQQIIRKLSSAEELSIADRAVTSSNLVVSFLPFLGFQFVIIALRFL